MKLEELHVGDRVAYRYNTQIKGVVANITSRYILPVGVVHDDYDEVRHDLGGLCKKGYGRWCNPTDLILIEESNASDFAESDKPLSFLFE